jgi:Putative MetA-pathway of phenol degradation
MGLPTGNQAVAGPGVQPYLQFPWSKKLTEDWGLSGMLTLFDRPGEPGGKFTTETAFVISRDFGESFELFTEYVGDFPDAGPSRQLINSGALWRLTKTQQFDLHVAFGLNSNSPDLIVGVGYSFRIDGLFEKWR